MEQWRKIIQNCQKSEQNSKAYCDQHGISEKMYYDWLRKLRKAVREAAPQIIELKPGREGMVGR